MFRPKHHLYFPHADNLDYTLSLDKLTIMDIGMKSLSRTVERFISKSGHLERGEHGEWAWQLKRAHNSHRAHNQKLQISGELGSLTKSSISGDELLQNLSLVELATLQICALQRYNIMRRLRYTIRINLKNIYCEVFWSLKPLYRQEAECNRTICHPWVGQGGIKWPKRHPWGEFLDDVLSNAKKAYLPLPVLGDQLLGLLRLGVKLLPVIASRVNSPEKFDSPFSWLNLKYCQYDISIQ